MLPRAADVAGLDRRLSGVPNGLGFGCLRILQLPGVLFAGVVGTLLDAPPSSLVFFASTSLSSASALSAIALVSASDATGPAWPVTRFPAASAFDGWLVSSLMPRNSLSTIS